MISSSKMTSTSDAEYIRSLNHISEQLNRYLSPTVFIFGVVGNILNCMVLCQRTLRSNPCALLFLVSSLIDLISILIGLPPRILAGWHLDPTAKFNSLCRLRAFVVFSTRTMATWLITIATIDRWLLSSIDVQRRSMSTVKNAQYSMLITFILSVLSFVHMFYCYEANLTDTPLQCYGKSQACRLSTDMIYSLITIIIPLILMIIFGLMTISNIHHVRVRVHNTANTSINHLSQGKEAKYRKLDHHLFRMLLIQIFLLIVLCVPQAIQKFHVTFKPFDSESELEDAIRHFLYNITLLLAFIASGMPFYIYTLAGGKVFRETFFDLMRNISERVRGLC